MPEDIAGSSRSAQSLLLAATTSDGEAEDIIDDVLDLFLLLELLAQLVAGIGRRAGTEGVLPAFLEVFLGGFSITSDLPLWTSCLVDVTSKK